MSDEKPEWLIKAETLVREYINASYTLDPLAVLEYDLDIAWTIATPVIQKVLFRTSIDDVRYLVTFEKVSGTDVETTIDTIEDGPMRPVI